MPRGTLKSSLLLVGTLGAARTQPMPEPPSMALRSPMDLEGIIQSVHAFGDAWFQGDQAALEAFSILAKARPPCLIRT